MNTLYFYRQAPGGPRVRYRFVVDDKQTILEEAPEPEPAAAITTQPLPGGGRVVTAISPEERRILTFFVESSPCWFEGCATLRAEYQAELARLGEHCPACQKGALIRKYQEKIRRATAATAPAA